MNKKEVLNFIVNATPQEMIKVAEQYSEPITITRLKRGYKCNFKIVSEYRGAVITLFRDIARVALIGEVT